MKRGHIPVRQCIGCRRKRPASELIRFRACGETVVVSPQKDETPGRGCYICPQEECLEAALRKGCLARALRRKIVVPPKQVLLKGLEQKR
ncbi:MAG: YlxR family protein [Desulfomonilaceae bacterium]